MIRRCYCMNRPYNLEHQALNLRHLCFFQVILTAVGVFFSTALLGFGFGLLPPILFYFYVLKKEPLPACFNESKRDFIAVLPMAAAVIYGILISSDLKEGWSDGKSALQLSFIAVYFLAAQYLKSRMLLMLLLLVLGIEFSISFYNYAVEDDPNFRFHGMRPFGTDAFFCMLFFLSAVFLFFQGYQKRICALCAMVSFAFMLLTQNRAMLIGSAILLTAMLIFGKMKNKKIGCVLLLALMGMAIFNPFNQSLKRSIMALNDAVTELEPEHSGSSMGTRYYLWKASWISLKETKGMGTGYGDYRNDLVRYQKEGLLPDDLNTLLHTHSIYLHPLMCAGIPGLLGIIITLAMLAYTQIKNFSRTGDHGYLLKIVLIVSVALTGIVDAHFEDGNKIFSLALFWALASCAGRDKNELQTAR